MSTFEDRLMSSLNADDEAFLKELEDDVGLFQQMGMTFSGPLKYWTAGAFLMSFAIFVLSMWAGYNMLQAEELKHVILWGALFGWASLGVGLIKVWFWMRMNHLNVLRELKRIELRLVKSG
ncbi:MAG: hypothetical protein HRT81_17800 [Henriciella sp.]|nr:hypothetical protein [Henriciella sp.]